MSQEDDQRPRVEPGDIQKPALTSMALTILEEFYRTRLNVAIEADTSAFKILLDRVTSEQAPDISPVELNRRSVALTGLTLDQLQAFDDAWHNGDIAEGKRSYTGSAIGLTQSIPDPNYPFDANSAAWKKLRGITDKTAPLVMVAPTLNSILHASFFYKSPITADEMLDLCAAIESDTPIVEAAQIPALPERVRRLSFQGRGDRNRIEQFWIRGDLLDMSPEQIIAQGKLVRGEIKARRISRMQEEVFSAYRDEYYQSHSDITPEDVVAKYIQRKTSPQQEYRGPLADDDE